MTWFTTGDVDEFMTAAGGFLMSRPAENTVLLTIVETLRARGSNAYGADDPRFGWWISADGVVASAFLQTPPHPVLLTRSPDAAAAALTALAQRLAALDPPVPGINIDLDAAETFTIGWRRHADGTAKTVRQMRLYRLGELLPPLPAVPGIARVAAAADRDLLISWYESFGREIGEPSGNLANVVDESIGRGGLTLWEVDGEPVSMAGLSLQVAGVARIAPVYTPAGLRRRGYAGALTAAVSQAALDAGADDVVLFTDLANPTSNSLYLRLGYRPVRDRILLSFAN